MIGHQTPLTHSQSCIVIGHQTQLTHFNTSTFLCVHAKSSFPKPVNRQSNKLMLQCQCQVRRSCLGKKALHKYVHNVKSSLAKTQSLNLALQAYFLEWRLMLEKELFIYSPTRLTLINIWWRNGGPEEASLVQCCLTEYTKNNKQYSLLCLYTCINNSYTLYICT